LIDMDEHLFTVAEMREAAKENYASGWTGGLGM
jgi:hypothetical protein